MTGNRVDLNGRPLALRPVDWDALMAPRTVVVIGATDTEGTQQRAQWLQVHERLTARGATVVPVHPTKTEILGTPAYPSVRDVPFAIDLAIVLVREPLPVLEECLELGVRAAVVFAAGFAEVGTEEGDEAQRRLEELSSGTMRVLGPNTNLNIFQPWRQDIGGKKLAIVTQSGFQGRPISQGEYLGIAIQSWATIGNEADLEFADFVGLLRQPARHRRHRRLRRGVQRRPHPHAGRPVGRRARGAHRRDQGGPDRGGQGRWPRPTPGI